MGSTTSSMQRRKYGCCDVWLECFEVSIFGCRFLSSLVVGGCSKKMNEK